MAAALIVAAMAPAAVLSAPKEAPKVSEQARKEGMAAAPAIVQAANLPCQVSDARLIGKTAEDKKKGTPASTFVEVACGAGNMGYVIQSPVGGAPTIFSCAEVNSQADPKNPGSLSCQLPGNEDPKMLTAFIAKAGLVCTPTAIRGIGHTPTATFFEVACQEGEGYVLQTSAPPDPSKPIELHNCLALDEGPNATLKCQLTQPAQRLAVVDRFAKSATPSCVVKDRRFVGNAQDGSDIYETSCQDGKGYIYKVAKGQVQQSWDCAHAANEYGGCQLTDSRSAATEQAALYTRLAKESGSNCQVAKYALFPQREANIEAVELACSDGTSAVGLFPATGKGQVLDCGHALIAGYKCGLGKADFSSLTADLVKYNAKSCQVSDARLVGRTPKGTVLVEVACADKLPGYMVEYATNPVNALAATGCRLAGNCTLPTNRASAASK